MKNLVRNLSIFAVCAFFATLQVSADTIMTGDTGLGMGNGGAVINGAGGGYLGTELGDRSATLNFNGDAFVNWDTLNLNADETLNFNAVDGAGGITVLNTVNNNISNIYGTINANGGISNLIISNPNGILFDGAHITTAGDTMITTQAMEAKLNGNNMSVVGKNTEAINGVVIKDSDFNIGGQFNIVSPSINVIKTAIKAGDGVKFITADGQNFLVAPTTNANPEHNAVRLESVSIDGNVYIASGKDIVSIVNGSDIKGNLTIETKGDLAINYNGEGRLGVTGDFTASTDSFNMFLRNADIGGNVNMSNSGGFVEIANCNVGGNVDLKTTYDSNKNKTHFVHVVGNNNITGDLNIDSYHNIHIGGYDDGLKDLASGNLNVGGDINAVSHFGNIGVTVNTTANNISLTSEKLNIITDDKSVIKANDYKFSANGYIGGIDDHNKIIRSMENYTLYTPEEKTFLTIDGGRVSEIKTGENGYAFIRSLNDMDVVGVHANNVNLSSAKDIRILGNNVHANTILVDGETKNLTVETPSNSRDYTLTYTNIRDAKKITIDKETEITYDMANGENGWNIREVRQPNTTFLVVPGGDKPVIPPTEPEVERHLKEIIPDDVTKPMANTPIAFAADLDDDIDNDIRKNVDGSVTVVRAFTPSK